MIIETTSETLRRCIAATHRTICKDYTRQNLHVLLLKQDAGRLVAVSTDGHRLARYETTANRKDAPEGEVLLPFEAVKRLRKILGKETSELTLVRIDSEGSISIECWGKLEFAKVGDVKFPPYERVIPDLDDQRDGNRYLCVNPYYLAEACEAFEEVEKPGKAWQPSVCVEMGAPLDPTIVRSERIPELIVVVMPTRERAVGYEQVVSSHAECKAAS